MSRGKLTSLISRLFFFGAFALLVVGVIIRIAYAFGYTFGVEGGRLLEIAVVFLIFVIAIQLREIREAVKHKP